MKYRRPAGLITFLLGLLLFAVPGTSSAGIVLESRLTGTTHADRAFQDRLEHALAQTEKRIKAVFGTEAAAKAVVVRSNENYDIKTIPTGSTIDGRSEAVVMINSDVAGSYGAQDLQIAAGRGLHQLVWPGFRKSYRTDNVMIERLYLDGMTAYAAELLYPGAKAWQYAGLYGKDGKGLYKQYLPLEKSLAEEAERALDAGAGKSADNRLLSRQGADRVVMIPAGKMLSYRIMKTFEKELDPKMIQLMDFKEFQERLPAALETLKQGFKPNK